MIRSMFTAVNSLYNQQVYMDMVADNLSNVNTPGFKSSYIRFKDQFAQTVRMGSAPAVTGNMGGTNPLQIGLGSNIGTVSQVFSQGALQSTGRELDLAISGDGFFVYRKGDTNYYSRDGSIALDAEGALVNSNTGEYIQGWQANGLGEVNTGNPLTDIVVPVDSTTARPTGSATLQGNLDANTVTTGAGTFNVTFGTYDSLGVLKPVTIQYTRQAPVVTAGPPPVTTNPWTWAVTSGGAGNGTIVFDTDGRWVSDTGTITVNGSTGTNPTTVDLDMDGITMLSSTNSVALTVQDGLAAGSLMGFNISSNTGEVFGVFSNGDQHRIGQLAMALFINPAGLSRQGNNQYLAGLNSGEPRIGAPSAGGRGTVASGYIEGSNVDMSREFSNMIMAQRGFQASSRIITTSDQMLQELVNLGR
jgi:flagellar hook protein FlgE